MVHPSILIDETGILAIIHSIIYNLSINMVFIKGLPPFCTQISLCFLYLYTQPIYIFVLNLYSHRQQESDILLFKALTYKLVV